MKAKKFKRLVSVLLSIVVLTVGITATAIDIPSPCYDGTTRISASLTISSTGRANCNGTIVLSSSSYSSDLTMKLQRSTGSGWSTVYTWNKDDASTISGSRYVTSGYYYRVVVSANVYDASGNYIESPSATSSSVYY